MGKSKSPASKMKQIKSRMKNAIYAGGGTVRWYITTCKRMRERRIEAMKSASVVTTPYEKKWHTHEVPKQLAFDMGVPDAYTDGEPRGRVYINLPAKELEQRLLKTAKKLVPHVTVKISHKTAKRLKLGDHAVDKLAKHYGDSDSDDSEDSDDDSEKDSDESSDASEGDEESVITISDEDDGSESPTTPKTDEKPKKSEWSTQLKLRKKAASLLKKLAELEKEMGNAGDAEADSDASIKEEPDDEATPPRAEASNNDEASGSGVEPMDKPLVEPRRTSRKGKAKANKDA